MAIPTQGNDRLVYGAANDVINALGGNDFVFAGAGNDQVNGNEGNDKLYGEDGNDHLRGGGGSDHIDGGAGLDIAYYTGKLSDYQITDQNGALHVTDLRGQGSSTPDGDDHLTNVEGLIFDDWGIYNDHFYIYVAEAVSYTEALAGAAELGGYLATVTSADENSFLTALMQNTGPANGFGGWLGGSDAALEDAWQWTQGPEAGDLFWLGTWTGNATGYENWHGGEPNDLIWPGEEDFAHMWPDGTWNDNSSTTLMGYFVEIG